jgi:G3E family GTPase
LTDIYLITGFLGAGKTTLMKKLIKLFERDNTALIVNEFGQESVDGALLEKEGMVIEEIIDGSIFCVCRSDKFIETILKTRELEVDTLIIEGSGLADPFGMDEVMKIVDKLSPGSFHYTGSICVVDVNKFERIYALAPAAKQQVQGADLILLNKVDTATREQIDNLEKNIRILNDFAVIIRTSFTEIADSSHVFALQWHKSSGNGVLTRKTLGISKFVISFDYVPVQKLTAWLSKWCGKAYRVKGFCGKYYIQAVQEDLEVSEFPHENPKNCLVVIAPAGDALKNELQLSWQDCFQSELSFDN